MHYDSEISINGSVISIDSPSYFIADIAANHDGNLERAKELIYLAKEAGADAAKFQHFKAEKIVSDNGFKSLDGKASHQAGWSKTVFETYRDYECNRTWTEELVKTAKGAKIDFISTPYDEEAVALLDPHVPAYKIGSGDITWVQFVEKVAQRKKPVFIATGASSMEDVQRAVEAILKHNSRIVLMQCNTNYTGCLENFKYIHLRVLQQFAILYPDMLLGFSDHTPGHAAVLGAIALGARVVEKHFTDDNNRQGPDHSFSMNPKTWREMINRSRELEYSLGAPLKIIEENEKETAVLQRRCLRLTRGIQASEVLQEEDLESLRPAPEGAVLPYQLDNVLGKKLIKPKSVGDALFAKDLEESA